MSTAWSIRAARVPRPPVCISRDPYRSWPLLVQLNPQWFTDDGGGVNFSSYGANVMAIRLRNTVNYTVIVADNEGRAWLLCATIPAVTPLVDAGGASFVATPVVGGSGFLPIYGRTNAWPQTTPFQSLEGDLRDFPTRVVGTWSYFFA